jgi:transcriptional regulatory protein LevR
MPINVNEIQLDPTDSTKTTLGTKVSTFLHLAWAGGSAGADTFNAAADVSANTLAVMATNGRGMYVNLGGGNDKATGTGYGDNFDLGAGTNYVDGGANAGTAPWGGKASDTLELYVADQAAANAVTLTALTGSGTAEEITAFSDGYTLKVVSGSEVNYIKNIEQINVQIWNDKNSNGQKDYGNSEVTFGRNIALAVNVNEVQLDPTDSTKTAQGTKVADQFHLAWANGTAAADTFNAAADVSANTLAVMATNGRGMYVNLGGGNDKATGTGYGDNFDLGAGTNYVDGGANAGTAPWGGKASDTLELYVADQAAANAVTLTALTGSGTAEEITAFSDGYTLKVVSGSEVNYVKNIEQINVQIWNDKNSNGQKDYGNSEVTFGRNIALAVNVNEVQLDPTDSTKTAQGTKVADQFHLAWANGTAAADTFNAAADVSANTLAVMATNGRGMYVNLGGGNDKATGTGYGDNFDLGAGTNYVDGGANAGTAPWGGKASDTLELYVADQAAANAVTLTALTGSGTAEEITAFSDGYTLKVVSGSEVNYIKNIEQINVQIWNDKNSNGQKDYGNSEVTFGRNIALAVNVNEVQLDPTDSTKTAQGTKVADQFHLAWANGTAAADTFNAAADVSANTLAVMATNGRGMYVNLGGGNDKATGTGYGDNFDLGAGTNYVDGGANAGTAPWGGKASDTLELYVADQAAANAVTLTALTGSGTAEEITAFSDGYTLKVVSGSEVNYVKNIEQINVQIWNDKNSNGQKDYGNSEVTFGRNIALAVNVNEVQLDPTDSTKTAQGTKVADQFHLAWANGTAAADTFNAAADVSANTLAVMATNGRGMYVNLGGGNDKATGTGYGDNFDLGAGTNYVDGGANAGTAPWGGKASDTLELYVADQAAANAVTLTALTGSGTAEEITAFSDGYTLKVVSGSEVNYIKNIEQINVQIWNDKNSNGQKDYGNSEVTFGRNIALAVNVNEVQLDPTDSTKTAQGTKVADQFHLAWANGTAAADTFNAAADVSANTLAVMATNGRGMYVNLGGGNDKATGTGYGDNFDLGAGTNYVDGGANAGTAPWGGKASDTLELYVADQAAANAVTLTALTGSGTAEEITAFSDGYTLKVVSGSEVNYVKNIEQINVQIWNDKNSNGQKDYGNSEVTFGRNIALAVNVNEVQLDPTDSTKTAQGTKVADQFHLAWANGTAAADTFNAAADVSANTLAVMATNGRGMYVNLGGGNDKATGTGYGDNFDLGAGTNYVDGGANAGTAPWGGKASDTLELYVADQAAANAVTLTALTGSGTAEEITAFSDGYTLKVVSGSEVNYIKNIEQINVQIWNDKNSNGQKDYGNSEVTFGRNIALAVNVNEVQLDPTDSTKTAQGTKVADQFHLAWANGTAAADTFNAAADVSANTLAVMATNGRGMYVNLGGGNDKATGTGYGDNFDLGAGTNYVDGGANAGTFPGGGLARDSLDLYVADQAAANAVTLTALTGSGTAEEITAFSDGYTLKVVSGSEVNYIKNIEQINVQIWNDKNTNGQKDYGDNEVTFGRNISLITQVFENTTNLASQFHMGSVNGTRFNDTLNLAVGSPLISSSLASNITSYQRGLFIQGDAGDDTITGTLYGDNINAGAGTNYIDAGENEGVSLGSINPARDSLELVVTSTAQAQAVAVSVLTGAATGADLAAFNANYRYKVVSTATGETDYVKNVETLSIKVWADGNSNGVIDYNLNELTTYRTRALDITGGDNVPSPSNQTPALGYMFGTQFKDTMVGDEIITALGKTIDPANPFGAFMFSLGGSDVVTGTSGTDFVVVSHVTSTTPAIGSHLVNGGADAGYYYYSAGAPTISADQYRMLEQRSNTEVPTPGATNGGLTTANFDPTKYRLVDLTKWSGYATTALDQLTAGAASELFNTMTGSAISTTDVTSIATTAAQVGLTMAGANGYTLAVIKYNSSGTLQGVDFLKNIETVQMGLWYDSNLNDVANGGATPETTVYATYNVAQDSYTLSETHKTWLDLTFASGTQSYAGILTGKSGSETLDASGLTIPAYYAAGTGFRMADLTGNDTVTGSAGNDMFGLGAGNDTINGGIGTDRAAVYWKADATKGDAVLSKASVLNGAITTITISQTQQGVTTDLFTLVNNGTNTQWTLGTTGVTADGFIRPQGTTTQALGTDVLNDVESLAVYLQSSVGIGTGGVTTSTPFEIELVGLPIV